AAAHVEDAGDRRLELDGLESGTDVRFVAPRLSRTQSAATPAIVFAFFDPHRIRSDLRTSRPRSSFLMRFLTSLAVVMSLRVKEWPTSRDEISIHRRNMSQHEIHCRNMSRHEMPIHCANIKLIVPCV